jgi:hypothetical protein
MKTIFSFFAQPQHVDRLNIIISCAVLVVYQYDRRQSRSAAALSDHVGVKSCPNSKRQAKSKVQLFPQCAVSVTEQAEEQHKPELSKHSTMMG